MTIEQLRARVAVQPGSLQTPCWRWLGYLDKDGYAICSHAGKHMRAQRVAFILLRGPLSPRQETHHECELRACVNAAHLSAVTKSAHQKLTDPGKFWRQRTHCHKGHEFVESNIYWRPDGSRVCRACETLRHQSKRKGPKTHCKHGHEFTAENTYGAYKSKWGRKCKTCSKSRNYYRK